MRSSITETHKTEIIALIPRQELSQLIAQHAAKTYNVDVTASNVSYDVTFEEAAEGSPAYPPGKAARVLITIHMKPPGAT